MVQVRRTLLRRVMLSKETYGRLKPLPTFVRTFRRDIVNVGIHFETCVRLNYISTIRSSINRVRFEYTAGTE